MGGSRRRREGGRLDRAVLSREYRHVDHSSRLAVLLRALMGIFHSYDPAATDDETNPDIVRPLHDWKDDHLSPAHLVLSWQEVERSNGDGWTDQPAAITRMFEDDRTHIIADLRYATSARLV